MCSTLLCHWCTLLCAARCTVCRYVLYTLGTVSITHVLLLGMAGYTEGLLHHPSHAACIHRGVEDTTRWTMAKEM